MKNSIIVYFAVAAAIVAVLAAFTISASASAKHPAVQEQPFEGSQAWQKLDLRFREAWKDATAAGDAGRLFECMIKIEEGDNKDDRAMLSGAGFMPRTFAGTIVTGSVRAGNVPGVARLPFVKAMELAVPLKLKKK